MLIACLLAVSIHQDQGEWRKPAGEFAQLRVLEIYEVSDLIDPSVIDFEPTELGRVAQPRRRVSAVAVDPSLSQPVAEPTREDRVRATETLAALIAKHVEPPLDAALDKLGPIGDGSLAFRANADQHAWTRGFLEAQRAFGGLIQTGARFFTVERVALERTQVANGTVFASKAEGDAFVAALQASPGLTELSAPRITTFARQRAHISVIDQFAFVQDWVVEIVEPNKQEIGDPQIGVINQGLVLDVRAMPMPGGKILAEIELQRCEVVRPVLTQRVVIGSAKKHEVEISLPVMDTVRLRGDVLLADGAGVVFSSSMLMQDRVFVAIVTLRTAALETQPANK